jgi:hypothetical protein
MFIKPGENPENPGTRLRVRIPHTFALLSEHGSEVPDNPFWRWMLRHGDVVECDPPKSEEPPQEQATDQPARETE